MTTFEELIKNHFSHDNTFDYKNHIKTAIEDYDKSSNYVCANMININISKILPKTTIILEDDDISYEKENFFIANCIRLYKYNNYIICYKFDVDQRSRHFDNGYQIAPISNQQTFIKKYFKVFKIEKENIHKILDEYGINNINNIAIIFHKIYSEEGKNHFLKYVKEKYEENKKD